MAVYRDFDGVYFTVQALRLYQDLTDCEILVVDNDSDDRLRDWLGHWAKGVVRYERRNEVVGTSYPRDQVFKLADSEWVICMDSHVMLWPGAVKDFLLWARHYPDVPHLLHGPMVMDSIQGAVRKMLPIWRDNMYGIWGDTHPIDSIPNQAFEIEMHGLGLFGCRKDAWLGFNPNFKGFGGEEGYIHMKYQKAGRKVLCVPQLKWLHKFGHGVNYPLDLKDRVRNYVLGWKELGLSLGPIEEHYGKAILRSVLCELG